jgi:hypothetical protein
MKIYHQLSNIKFLKKYSYKFLFVAFIGIHIPLIGMIVFVISSQGEKLQFHYHYFNFFDTYFNGHRRYAFLFKPYC